MFRASRSTIFTKVLGSALAAALFFAAAPGSISSVKAAPAQCSGNNMLTEFKSSDPELYKRVMDEASKVENTEALLWKVEKDGIEPSYLFGTIHIPDQRVVDIPVAAQDALKNAKTLVVEVAGLDEAGMMAAVAKAPQLLAYVDGSTLQSQLTEEEFAKVVNIVGKSGMPAEAAVVLRPWLVSMLLAISDCQRAQMAAGDKALDAQLEADAKAAGAKVVGLETAESQLASLASIPNDQQILMLKSGLAYADRTDDLVETLVELYLDRNLGVTMPFQIALAEKAGIAASAFDGFIKTLLVDRNEKMAETAQPLIDKGNAFVAVGALHLSGKTGLVALLRDAGYKVTAMK